MPILRCPTCKKAFDTAAAPAMPFCSERCRLIDLGRWFDEEHGLPHIPDDEFPDEVPPDG